SRPPRERARQGGETVGPRAHLAALFLLGAGAERARRGGGRQGARPGRPIAVLVTGGRRGGRRRGWGGYDEVVSAGAGDDGVCAGLGAGRGARVLLQHASSGLPGAG